MRGPTKNVQYIGKPKANHYITSSYLYTKSNELHNVLVSYTNLDGYPSVSSIFRF